MTIEETKEYHLKKLFELSKNLSEDIPQLEEPTDEQKEWFERRMKGPAWTWERWHGLIEEWTPWNRNGEWINQLRYFKK